MNIGHKIIHLESVDSTNNYVANLIKHKKIVNGTVIMADEQFAGRGQRDSNWSVIAGKNLTFSFYIDNVNLSVAKQFQLTQLVSVSLIHLLKKNKIEASIKWPNDIFVGNRKIAGVLIENQIMGQNLKSSIVGIGININQKTFEGFNATSTILETKKAINPSDLLLEFIMVFNDLANHCSQNSLDTIYKGNLYLLETNAKFRDANGLFYGKIKSVNEAGKLIMEREEGIAEYLMKEVEFVN